MPNVGRGPVGGWRRSCGRLCAAAGPHRGVGAGQPRRDRPACRPRTSACCRRCRPWVSCCGWTGTPATRSSAMRLAKLVQVSTRLDQLMQKLDDNAEYMRDLSARVDLLATRQGIPTLGEYKPPSDRSAGGETAARGGPVHLRGGRAGPQPRQHRSGPGGFRGVPGQVRQQRSCRRRPLLAGRSGLRRG